MIHTNEGEMVIGWFRHRCGIFAFRNVQQIWYHPKNLLMTPDEKKHPFAFRVAGAKYSVSVKEMRSLAEQGDCFKAVYELWKRKKGAAVSS